MSRLVLLSGWGIDARIWQPLARHWPAQVSVTAPDWPGYATRAALESPQDLNSLAEAMALELPADAVWVGWSLGGLLAAALLERLPVPRGLVMLGMGSRFTVDENTGSGVTPQELAAFRLAFARDPQRTWQHFLRLQLSGEPAPRQALRRLEALLGDTLPADRATLAAGLDQLAMLDKLDTLVTPPCPVGYVRGAQDPLLPELAAHEAPCVLADSGHCPQLSAPRELARCLSALAQRFDNVAARLREHCHEC